MTTLSSPEMAQALADCAPGEEVSVTVMGTCNAARGLDVTSITKADYNEAAEEGAPTAMPPAMSRMGLQ